MKYFRFFNGHESLPKENWLIVGTYAESRLEARRILNKVLYLNERDESDIEPDDPGLTYQYIDERDLEEGEEPSQTIYGYIPLEDGTHEYPEKHSWEQSY